MIKISREQLEESREISQQPARVVYWLWEKWEDIPWEDAAEEDGAVKLRETTESGLVSVSKSLGVPDHKRREIVKFREIFESDSPAFYGKFWEFSDFKRIIQDYNQTQREGGSCQWMEPVQIEIRSLHLLARVSLLALYPLFLANNEEFPFLLPDEIREAERVFSFDETLKEMRKINSEWCEEICQIFDSPTHFAWPAWCEKHKKTIFLLIWFFLKGVQKT